MTRHLDPLQVPHTMTVIVQSLPEGGRDMEKSHFEPPCPDTESDHIEHSSLFETTEGQNAERGIPHVPSAVDPGNPLNWPQWKKDVNLVLISFHALMTNFIGAGIIPVYATLAAKFGVSVQDVSYFTSVHILCTGVAPFVFLPLSRRFGRRPVWLISTLCTAVCNVGCAESNSYAAMMVCRTIGSLFLGAPIALGPPVVLEMYHAQERAYKLGIWTLFVTLGPPVGPFIMGFVAQRVGWEWIYWTFAIVSGIQFVLYLFLSPETRYIAPGPIEQDDQRQTFLRQCFTFRRIDKVPLNVKEIYEPFLRAGRIRIILPICSHSMIFCLSAAMLTVEIPQLFGPRYGFDSQQIGLQFLGIIIGTLAGEIACAILHKLLRAQAAKHNGSNMKLSWYICLSHVGFVCMMVGLVIFCIQLDHTAPMNYNVTPIVGVGIAGFGNQMVANFLINYVMQLEPEHAAVTSVLLGLIRQTWCFIGPFWFPPMFDTLGFLGSMGLLVGLVALSCVPMIWIQWKYKDL